MLLEKTFDQDYIGKSRDMITGLRRIQHCRSCVHEYVQRSINCSEHWSYGKKNKQLIRSRKVSKIERCGCVAGCNPGRRECTSCFATEVPCDVDLHNSVLPEHPCKLRNQSLKSRVMMQRSTASSCSDFANPIHCRWMTKSLAILESDQGGQNHILSNEARVKDMLGNLA